MIMYLYILKSSMVSSAASSEGGCDINHMIDATPVPMPREEAKQNERKKYLTYSQRTSLSPIVMSPNTESPPK